MYTLINKPTIERMTALLLAAAILLCFATSGESVIVKPPAALHFNPIDKYEAKVMFPNGANLCFTYGFGASLGVEKQLLEPTIPFRKTASL